MAWDAGAERRWRRRTRATWALLGVWFATTVLVGGFAADLDATVLGWPVGFWLASQGALAVYVALVWVNARWLATIDRDAAAGGSAAAAAAAAAPDPFARTSSFGDGMRE